MRTGKLFYWTLAALIQPFCLLVIIVTLSGDWTPDRSARQVAARRQIESLVAALRSYKHDTGHFPEAAEGLQALRENPGASGWRGPYLQMDTPSDPWGWPYLYRIDLGDGLEVVSFGADGKPGGNGLNADTSSLRLGEPIRRSRLPLMRLAVLAAAAIGFFGYPLLPRLLRYFSPKII
jgi:general secretion pathway protein G